MRFCSIKLAAPVATTFCKCCNITLTASPTKQIQSIDRGSAPNEHIGPFQAPNRPAGDGIGTQQFVIRLLPRADHIITTPIPTHLPIFFSVEAVQGLPVEDPCCVD